MRVELDEKLCAKYPKIFADRRAPPTHTAMCWGFECGDGWYTLIDALCAMLMFDPNTGKDAEDPPVATQVKEKFGSLRFYVRGASVRQYNHIEFAEYLSSSVCEDCGTTTNVRSTEGGWIRSLCPTCMEKKDES